MPGGFSFTPTRRALERPIAMACSGERAPCLPFRICSISSCTNSPACVVGALPRPAAFCARLTVFFSGITLFTDAIHSPSRVCGCVCRNSGPFPGNSLVIENTSLMYPESGGAAPDPGNCSQAPLAVKSWNWPFPGLGLLSKREKSADIGLSFFLCWQLPFRKRRASSSTFHSAVMCTSAQSRRSSERIESVKPTTAVLAPQYADCSGMERYANAEPTCTITARFRGFMCFSAAMVHKLVQDK